MRTRCNSRKTRVVKPWKLFVSLIILLALAVNASASSSQTLALKEELNVPANVVHIADLNQDVEMRLW